MSSVLLTALCLVALRITIPSEAIPFYRQDSEECSTPVCQEAARYLLDSMNSSADPCEDFYEYACGGWISRHPMPEEKSMYSTFDILNDGLLDTIGEMLGNATNEVHAKSILDSATLFQGCIDTETRDTKGLGALKSLLTSLGGWPMSTPGWNDANYQWYTQVPTAVRILDIAPIISVYVDADANQTSRYIITLDQPHFGIGRNQLVNLTESDRTKEIVAAYKTFSIAAAKLLNPDADETQLGHDADQMIEFESKLAQFSKPKEERRHASSWYHKMTVADVQSVTENKYFQWTDFLNSVLVEFPRVMDDTNVILSASDYMKNALRLAHNTNPRVLANYIGWILLKNIGHHTTSQFREIKFQFEKVETGVQKQEKLERICAQNTIEHMGMAVGRLYVDKYFTAQEKQDADDLVENIRSAYKSTLSQNTWMDENTKNKAIEKLETMISKMGYPKWIKDDERLNEYYSSVQGIRRNEFFSSLLKVKKAITGIQLKKWNQPTDRANDWVTEPPVVNAFYSPDSNSMTFPAGILNLPFYKYGRSDALNYGGIGIVIGHEMSHGFDDQGGQHDTEGNLVNWWSDETKEKFNQKADCFRKQYSAYVDPTTNMNLNGNNTVGENIADNGAVRNAFIAYKMHERHSQDNVVGNKRLPGVSATPEQLFFLGFSTMWCGTSRKEILEWLIQYEPHTPNAFRAVIPLSNSKDFAEAFNCASGSRMNPVDKCLLW